MLAEQSINFDPGNAPWIIIWVSLLMLVLLSDKGKGLIGDRRRVLKVLAIRLLVGFLFTAAAVGLLSVWIRWGPQYFITLRLQESAVVLKFRGSGAEVEVPFRDIKSIAIVDSGTARHPCKRLQIETSSQEYQSFGFRRLDDNQLAVLNAFRSRAGAKMPLERQ